ncbi:MAG: hypothetical protein Q4C61_12085 [Lachnospiraceae bacterium]|nr:hypothetical protein [Lachnospiraceae bacterium]
MYSSFEDTGTFYYIEYVRETKQLDEYVENTYAVLDAEIEEPDYDDIKYKNDYELYELNYEVYEEAQERIDLLEDLSEIEYVDSQYSLYYYDASAGEAALISEQLENDKIPCELAYSNHHLAAAYFKRDSRPEKINIDTLLTGYDGSYEHAEQLVRNYINNSIKLDVCYCTVDGSEEQVLSESPGSLIMERNDMQSVYLQIEIYNNGQNIAFLGGGYNENAEWAASTDILAADIKNKKIGALQKITSSGPAHMGTAGDHLLYYSNSGEEIYLYMGGRHILAAEAGYSTFNWYKDGSALVLTDYDYTYGGTLVKISESGEKERILEEVKSFEALDDGKIVYLSGEKLKVFDGKESRIVAYDVDNFWCLAQSYLLKEERRYIC